MAEPQDVSSFAWALRIGQTPTPILAATRDLDSEAAVATLGAFYPRLLKTTDSVLSQSLPNLFYGIGIAGQVTFVIDNSGGIFDQSLEWRLVPITLTHYDLNTDTAVVDFTGIVAHVQFINSEAHVTVSSDDAGIMDTLLPAAVIDPTPAGPFANSGSANLPVPVLFGSGVPIKVPNAARNTDDVVDPFIPNPGGYTFLVCHGRAQIDGVNQDIAPEIPGLEALGVFAAAPGNPVYVSTTKFSVTGDHSPRYTPGDPVRFLTTASPSTFLVSFVKAYDAGSSPHEVELEDALLDAGMTSVQIGGDWQGIMGYVDVTDGLLPVPAGPGADFTAVLLYDSGDAATIVRASSRDWPISTTLPSYVIEEIITDATWGLSAHTTQTVDSTSFGVASVLLALAGLTGAVRGALAYDQQQRRAGAVLEDIMILRGMRLGKNADGEWQLFVDAIAGSADKTFHLRAGDASGIKIKRLVNHGRRAVNEAIRSVTVHWDCLGRVGGATAKFTPREYGRRSKKIIGTVGRDHEIFNQFIRDQTTAELVTHYVAEKLRGADEMLEFVAGVEARDVQLGESIVVDVPSDGIDGHWSVHAIRKTLTEVTLSCFRENVDAFDTPADVVTTNAPDPEEPVRTSTGTGVNLLPNPDFSAPHDEYNNPHYWVGGADTTVTPNASAALVGGTVGGEYVQLVVSSSTPPSNTAWAGQFPGIHTLGPLHSSRWSAPSNTLLIVSVYCSRATGLYFAADWFHSGFTQELIPVYHDPTDANGNGWTRFYGRVRTPTGTTLGSFTIGCSEAGTYLLDGAMVETVERSARKPSRWKRHKAQPRTLFATATVTFNGASSYAATNLIPVGARVIGVTGYVVEDITLGSGTTGYSIGTANTPGAWAENVAVLTAGQKTSATNFRITTQFLAFNTTTVFVEGVGGTGAIDDGALRLQVEYEKAAVATAA